jgi:type IV pilus assembly protein PilA
MLARIHKAMEDREEGFTLIELLVVIIIIGILAAIAIPVFLNQRKKGYDAAVKADLRNAATAEESYLTDFNAYTSSGALLVSGEGAKKSTGDTISPYADGSNGYCIVGGSSGDTSNFYLYDSQAGGLSTTAFTSAANALTACSDATAKAATTTSE